MKNIPKYLQKYVVDQNYDQYSPIDHACWRFIMKINKEYFSKTAHHKYLEGLDKTGITIESIPNIKDMNKKMQKFGWSVVGVKGFLPPLIFMDFQSKGILPVACDMRSIEHLTYTPAPDIVHEAAGHSPMIADSDYAEYLKYYGQIARKAIYSSEDYNLYVAIRNLSDIKENPKSTAKEIKDSENCLKEAINSISYISEASYLGRVNWWTVEYGLIGDFNNPKIYGAGLLSSIGESENCLKDKVKKIPMSIDCLDYSYDITEQQPQLFVSEDFKSLKSILDQISNSMAYKVGGLEGINKAIEAKSVCTLELNSKIQISGEISNSINLNDSAIYVQLTGPTQICYNNNEVKNQGIKRHMEGFGSPIGKLNDGTVINKLNSNQFADLGYRINQHVKLQFKSGVMVSGKIKNIFEYDGKIKIITFLDCNVKYNNQILFNPDWGEYDMVCGERIDSVFGGPADIDKYFESQNYNNEIIKLNDNISRTNTNPDLNQIYFKIRKMRDKNHIDISSLEKFLQKIKKDHQDDWLASLEIYELAFNFNGSWIQDLKDFLWLKASGNTDLAKAIKKYLQLIESSKA